MTNQSPSLPLSNDSKKTSVERAQWITSRSSILFSAYRRDDFADASGFLAQLNLVLEGYSDTVIIEITSPQTGLQRRSKFPPTIAEVVEACDIETVRIARIHELSKLRAEPHQGRPRRTSFVNVHVPRSSPKYQLMVEKSQQPGVDPREFWHSKKTGGIWVSMKWLGL